MAAPSPWTFTSAGRTNFLNGVYGNMPGDTVKMALFLSTSNIGAGSTTYAGVTNEVANGLGYTTGGVSVTFSLSGTTTVTATLTGNAVWTASGGSITGRFGVIYIVAGNVICYCTLDSTPADVTATDTNTFTVSPSGSGIFTLA
jgi:hypothetical protein